MTKYPKIALIAALSKNHVIGKDNQLPWTLPNDLQHFKSLTLHKPIVMGRKTFESIGRPLPKRRNIIITRQKDFQVQGGEVFHSMDSALTALQDEAEIMIIGGATLYQQTLAKADILYLTIVDTEIAGDAFFPEWNSNEWKILSEEKHDADEQHAFAYTFLTLARELSHLLVFHA